MFGKDRYLSRRGVVSTRTASPSSPTQQYFVGRQHQVLRRDPLPAARARLRRGRATTAASRPPGRSPTTTSSPTTPRPSSSTTCTAQRGEDPTEPPALGPVPVPGRLARAAHPAAARRPRARPGTSRSTCRSASSSTRPTRAQARCIRCDRFDGFPCLVDGKADAHVLCVRPALEHPTTSRCVTGREGRAARDRRDRPQGDRRRRRARRRRRRRYSGRRRRRLLRRDQLRGAAAALGQRPAPGRARQLLRRRRAPLHGAHQLGA